MKIFKQLSVLFTICMSGVLLEAAPPEVWTERLVDELVHMPAGGVQSVLVVLDEDYVSAKKGTLQLPGVTAPQRVFKQSFLSAKKGALTPRGQRAQEILQNTYRADLTDGNLDETLAELKKLPYVVCAEPNYRLQPCAVPNDTFFDHVWALSNSGQTYRTTVQAQTNGTPGVDIGWLDVWDTPVFPTNEIIVAVIDTGVDYEHFDITNRMWKNSGEIAGNGIDDDGNGYIDDIFGIDAMNDDSDPMDDVGHGTHCAGTIAAEANNHGGIIGVNPFAKIMSCKFLGPDGGYTDDALECIEYAVSMGATVLNNSWGGGSYSDILQNLITWCNEQGVVFLAAAGNSNAEYDYYPAAYDGVIAVAATDSDDVRAYFSNYGSYVDVSAPGQDILSLAASVLQASGSSRLLADDSRLAVFNGTSMSTPYASGVISLMMAQNPGLPPFLYSEVISETCDDIYSIDGYYGNTGYVGKLGSGRINLAAALSYDVTNAFLDASVALGGEFGVYQLVPGGTVDVSAVVGNWTYPMTGMTVRISNLSTGLTALSSTTFELGTLSAYAVTNLPDDAFTVQVVEDESLWGTSQSLQVDLMQGSVTVDTERLSVRIFSTDISEFSVIDLENDGFKEILGLKGSTLYCFDYSGNLQWLTTVPDVAIGAVSDIVPADIDGDGIDEVVVGRESFFGGGAVYAFDQEGSLIRSVTGMGMVKALNVADLDGDGTDEVLAIQRAFDGTGRYISFISALDVDAEVGLWNQYPRDWDYFLTEPAIGDVQGDSKKEVFTVDYFIGDETTIDPGQDISAVLNVIDGQGVLQKKVTIPGNVTGAAYPAVGDLDGDGIQDVVFKLIIDSQAYTYAYNMTAEESFPNFPMFRNDTLTYTALADLDKDGDLEIIGFDEHMPAILAYHHDGSMVDGFPVIDTNAYQTLNLAVADVNNDDSPEIIYMHEVVEDESAGTEYYDIVAIDSQGLRIPGYPVRMHSQFKDAVSRTYSFCAVEELTPGYLEGESGNAIILSTMENGLKMHDTGYAYNGNAAEWPTWQHDWKHTAAHVYRSPTLELRLTSTNRVSYGPLDAQFFVNITGAGTNDVYISWDFDNDGIPDLVGTNSMYNPVWSYTEEGTYTVSVTVSNLYGDSFTLVKTNFITRYPSVPPSPDFKGDILTGSAPLQVRFTDLSSGGVDGWAWDFDGDTTTDSTERNPAFLYTNAGTYAVTLIGTRALDGVSATNTKTSYITITGEVGTVTTRYLSKSGSSVYPYKNWAEAATNLQDVIDACSPNDTILISNGVYTASDGDYIGLIRTDGLTLRGMNGPEVTVLDGEYDRRCVMQMSTNITYDGLTFRHGYASMGAGMLVVSGTANITNCVFTKNRLDNYTSLFSPSGAGLAAGSIVAEGITVTVSRCTFSSNYCYMASAIANGGGDTWIFVDGCTFFGNEAMDASATISGSTPRNSVFYDNWGGVGVSVQNDLDHCTIVSNYPYSMAVYTSYESIRNCIIYGNHAIVGTNDNYWGPVFTNEYGETFANLIYPYLDFPGCVTNAPVFANAACGDYRLMAGSPGIDQGSNWWTTVMTNTGALSIDLGPASNQTGDNYNNITNISDSSFVVSNLVYRDGTGSGFAISFSNVNFTGYVTGAYPHTGETNPASCYSDGIIGPSYYTNWIYFENLNPDSFYVFEFQGSQNDAQSTTILNDLSGPTINGHNTLKGPATFGLRQPDENGVIRFKTYSTLGNWLISSIGVVEYTELNDTQPLTNWTDFAGNARIYGSNPDIGAYEYHGGLDPVAVITVETNDFRRAPHNVAFSAANSYDPDGSIISYSWDFGDGSPVQSGAGLTSVSHAYPAASYYNVQLTVEDDTGRTHTGVFHLDTKDLYPDPAELLHAEATAGSQVSLSWTDASTDETGFIVERRTEQFPPYEVIIDDADPEPFMTFFAEDWYHSADGTFLADWYVADNPSAYGGSYHYMDYETPPNNEMPRMIARFHPHLEYEGLYEIFARWPDSSSIPISRENVGFWSPLACYEVYAKGGFKRVYASQTRNPGEWVSLGTFYMDDASFVSYDTEHSTRHGTADAMLFRKIETFESVAVLSAGTTGFVDTASSGLVDGRTYTYRIVATNSAGAAPPSNQQIVGIDFTNARPVAAISPISSPPTVNIAFAVDGSGSYDIDGAITNYVWNFGDGYSGSVQSGSGLTSATYRYPYAGTYQISLEVYDDQGRVSTNEVSVSVSVREPAPHTPVNLNASAEDGVRVRITWNDTSSEEDQQRLQRQVDAGVFSNLAVLDANVEEYVDNAVGADTVYSYRVRAENAEGTSDWSNIDSAVLGSEADYSLPFEETFETSPDDMAGTPGSLQGQHGWKVSGSSAVIQSAEVYEGAQALEVTDASVQHVFLERPTSIWIRFNAKGSGGIEPESIDSNVTAVFYINEDLYVVAYSNQTAITQAVAVSAGWNAFEVFCDYSADEWSLSVNDTNLFECYPFYSSQSGFTDITFSQNTTNTAWFDSISLTDENPAFDSDDDGMSDDWERLHFGGTYVSPSAMASNGINTLIETYIAGIDPNDRSARFDLSNVRNILSWSMVSGRVYTVYWTSNLLNGFEMLESNVTGSVFTDAVHEAGSENYYKIDVQIE